MLDNNKPSKTKDCSVKLSSGATPIINIGQLPTVDILSEVDWWYTIPVLKSLIIDLARVALRRCRLIDPADGTFIADPDWTKWLARFKKMRSKWVAIASRLLVEYRIKILPKDIKKYAELITDQLYGEIESLPATSLELSKPVAVDADRHRQALAKVFPELAIEIPVAASSSSVVDMGPMTTLLQQLLSVNQSILAQTVSQSANQSVNQSTSQSLSQSATQIPDHDKSDVKLSQHLIDKSSSTPKSAIKPSRRTSSDEKQLKLAQSIAYLSKNSIPSVRSNADFVDQLGVVQPSLDLHHQIARKKADDEMKNQSTEKKRVASHKRRASSCRSRKQSKRRRSEFVNDNGPDSYDEWSEDINKSDPDSDNVPIDEESSDSDYGD